MEKTKEGNEAKARETSNWTVVEHVVGHGDLCDVVRRLPVPGGWLYQVSNGGFNGCSWSSPVFVPEPTRRRAARRR